MLNLRVRKEEALPTLFIDGGDVVLNELIFINLKARKDEIEKAAGFGLEWDEKPGRRSFELIGPVTDDCGWATESEVRSERFEAVLNDYVKLKKAVEPVLKQAVDEAEQDFGDQD